MAHIFKALSDETRLRIMGLLLEGELCVCDLMSILELPQSTVSRHLAYLRTAGLVEGRRDGVWMHYRTVTGDNGLSAQVTDLLKHNLPSVPQAGADQLRLKRHLAEKHRRAC